jgi:hypothetical protein
MPLSQQHMSQCGVRSSASNVTEEVLLHVGGVDKRATKQPHKITEPFTKHLGRSWCSTIIV